MRQIEKKQLTFGQVDISEITFDLRCRDEIPKLLSGWQYIYCHRELREQVFEILEKIIPSTVTTKTGRPGMELWKIFVLGTLRLNCNWNYDKLHDIANNHLTLRQMLGHSGVDDDYVYHLQTLKDNVRLLTEEVLDTINQIVVTTGHKLLQKESDNLALHGRCDSFVVETNVHYPTDINLLWDAVRKSILLVARCSDKLGLSQWRQSRHHLRKIKKLFHGVRRLKHSTSGQASKQAAQSQKIQESYQAYAAEASQLLSEVEATVSLLKSHGTSEKIVLKIERFMGYGWQLLDQIDRRVIKGEPIAHQEKIFSVFEAHTEWISKGKAGVPQELGKRVCIVEDQYGVVLQSRVMDRQTDDKVAVDLLRETKSRYQNLRGCSFDKGFWSPSNKKQLEELLDVVILPKKGRCSGRDEERERSSWFVSGRRRHSAVESAINALENHGLDRCSDHGIASFNRYVSLAVVARNIQKLGHILQVRKLRRQQRRAKYNRTLIEGKYGLAA